MNYQLAMINLHFSWKRQSSDERQRRLEFIREEGKPFLSRMDELLKQYGGRRLSEDVNALGCVTVESSVEGIFALANLDFVKSILEDQAVSLLR